METVEAVVDDEASLDDDDGGLLRLEVKAIALFVSLKPGSCGKIGVEDFPLLALQGADLCPTHDSTELPRSGWQ
ncbi:hypothetical protein NC653_041910 [Populus alba x Populus x berolinensis]|uniref:Uncharacterized protein n=1 Tax=Populus alba x Populus x berolinensis TaxID=444605 RepID=A0AAD6L9N7_9ROSI|nr:hypothetical protein NC653_041864 [Populus alba x Populus x berolinensis]KAJ6952859.1 hypothetical protein NC653_041873 [Populus alba x Populus x berolinensis]KAJ6952908.1 hypothetical protein NC653_041910 [Populus alba x Populus x berolinensis]